MVHARTVRRGRPRGSPRRPSARIDAAPTSPDVGSWTRLLLSGVAMPESCQMAGTLYLGTSGFSDDQWKHGVFYPEGLKNREMLSYYASRFPSVEDELHVPALPDPEVARDLEGGDPRGLPVHAQGQPTDHALEAAGRRGPGRPGLPGARAAVGRSPRDRPLPVPTHAHVRPCPHRVLRRLPATHAEIGHGVPPPLVGAGARPVARAGRGLVRSRDRRARPGPRRPVVGAVRVPPAAKDRVRRRGAPRLGGNWNRPSLEAGRDIYYYFKHEDEGLSTKIELELGERPRDVVEQADAVGRAHLDHGEEVRRRVVDRRPSPAGRSGSG